MQRLTSPFHATASASPQKWWERLLRRPDEASAAVAVERELASAHPEAIGFERFSAILHQHRVGGSRACSIAMWLWNRAVQACASDAVFTPMELNYLAGLRGALGLSERDVSHTIYRAALEASLADGHLTLNEHEELELLAAALSLPHDVRDMVSREPIGQVLQRTLDSVLSDQRLTPEEERQLAAIKANLCLTGDFSGSVQSQLDRCALLWRIENGEMPSIEPGIALQRGEVCHCQFSAEWYELRTRRIPTVRHGPVASIRIMKGLHYRVSAMQSRAMSIEEQTLIDEGTAYLTNKRLIFDGARKNTTIRHAAVIALTPFSDGIGIEKASGKSPTLQVSGDAEIITALYAEALARSG